MNPDKERNSCEAPEEVLSDCPSAPLSCFWHFFAV